MGGGRRGRAAAAGDRPDGVPRVEIERPANPAFGDLATNLAMKLARPLRRPPLEIAEVLAASLTAVGSDEELVASVEVARPGFLNLRVADAAYEGLIAGILANPEAWGRIPSVNPRSRQRRVRVGEPDRAAHRGQCAWRVRGRPPVPRPRGGRAARHARVLLQRLGDAGEPPRRVGRRRAAPRARAGGRLQGCLRGRPRPRGSRGRLACRERAGRGCDGHRGTLGGRSGPPGHRAQPHPPRRPVRRLDAARRACTTRAGSSGRSSACALTTRCTSRMARSGSEAQRGPTTRIASCCDRTGGRRTSPQISAT